LLIIYLGKRGGGALFTRQIAHELSNKIDGVCVYLVDQNEEIDNFPRTVKLRTLNLYSKRFGNFVKIIKFPSLILNSIVRASRTSTNWILIPMMSPLDFPLSRILQMLGFKIVRVIHDFSPHPGDRWPTKKSILRAAKFADQVICLSDYVANSFRNIGINVEKSRFPDYQPLHAMIYRKKSGQICFLGRGNDYKDLEVLKILTTSQDFRACRFLVAGHLADLISPSIQSSRLISLPGWLSLKKLEEIIAESEAIVLPYISASQSGLVDIAEAFSTKVIATPVGGLVEQVGNALNGYIASSTDPMDIAIALKLALGSPINEKNDFDFPSRNVVDSVLHISQRVK
jgi:glycosyltransferase involved in cell wall biosynthesis